ncbi:MAG TPA: AraC family transcriptional regulator [Thermoanaerobaculia bacterium]|nr:AraC family transcriptional regulator [Thermoanaerobaculia bacterium]
MRDARPCTHGESVTRLATESFIVTRARYDANARVAWHEHERRGLTFVLRGSMSETFALRALECGANTLIAKPPDARHHNAYGTSGADCVIVEVQPVRAASLARETDVLDRIAKWNGGAKAAIARRLARELRTNGTGARLIAEALALELIAATMRVRSDVPAWLTRAEEFVHDEFRRIASVSEVAAIAGVHPVHLARGFRAHTGSSVADTLRRLRLDWAADVMLDENRPILDVALDCGYADQSHFTRAFTARFGVPPARYRRCAADRMLRAGKTRTRRAR